MFSIFLFVIVLLFEQWNKQSDSEYQVMMYLVEVPQNRVTASEFTCSCFIFFRYFLTTFSERQMNFEDFALF